MSEYEDYIRAIYAKLFKIEALRDHTLTQILQELALHLFTYLCDDYLPLEIDRYDVWLVNLGVKALINDDIEMPEKLD